VSLPLVAIDRASGSVSEICLSGAARTAASSAFNLRICSRSEAILSFSPHRLGFGHLAFLSVRCLPMVRMLARVIGVGVETFSHMG
jgi:hypothetical protein